MQCGVADVDDFRNGLSFGASLNVRLQAATTSRSPHPAKLGQQQTFTRCAESAWLRSFAVTSDRTLKGT